MLSFIPLIRDDNLISTEASLKYFLTQALASSILLFSVILLILNRNLIDNLSNNWISLMILSRLLLKTGAAPFHFWFPNIMEGLSWSNSLIVITWQKIAPIVLISYIIVNSLIIFSIIASVLVGSLGGLNQTSLRKLKAFSSINHLGWILAAIQTIWLVYFLLYSLLSFRIIYFFNMFKISHLNQLFSLYFNSKIIKIFIFLNLLSLGGLPPFLGFFSKWIVIQYVAINRQLFLLFVLTVTTLITLYFYLRICYAAFIINYTENNWINFLQINKFSKNIYLFVSFISIIGIIFIPIIFSII